MSFTAETLVYRGSKLHAVIIGIGTYKHKNFQVYDYLTESSHLKVPPSNITLLRNKETTREGILRALDGLVSRTSLHREDLILVYYGGHGLWTMPWDKWELEDDEVDGDNEARVRVIIPYDCDETVPGITNQMIGEYLYRLAAANGNNIVTSAIPRTESRKLRGEINVGSSREHCKKQLYA